MKDRWRYIIPLNSYLHRTTQKHENTNTKTHTQSKYFTLKNNFNFQIVLFPEGV